MINWNKKTKSKIISLLEEVVQELKEEKEENGFIPPKPLDPGEYTAQIYQFSSVQDRDTLVFMIENHRVFYCIRSGLELDLLKTFARNAYFKVKIGQRVFGSDSYPQNYVENITIA